MKWHCETLRNDSRMPCCATLCKIGDRRIKEMKLNERIIDCNFENMEQVDSDSSENLSWYFYLKLLMVIARIGSYFAILWGRKRAILLANTTAWMLASCFICLYLCLYNSKCAFDCFVYYAKWQKAQNAITMRTEWKTYFTLRQTIKAMHSNASRNRIAMQQ